MTIIVKIKKNQRLKFIKKFGVPSHPVVLFRSDEHSLKYWKRNGKNIFYGVVYLLLNCMHCSCSLTKKCKSPRMLFRPP